MLVGIWYTIAHALRRTTSRRSGPLETHLVEHYARRDAEIQAAVDEAVQAAVAKAIKETTALFLRRFYGPRNERFDPRQLLLFGVKIDEMPLDEASIAEESQEELATRRAAKRHKHGRRHCPTICRASTSSTILPMRRSRARPAASCASGSARRSASNSNTCRRRSRCCGTSATNTAADGANTTATIRRSRPRRSPRSRSTRGWLGRGCWPTSSRASSATTCRFTGWNTSSSVKTPDRPQHDVRPGLRPRESWPVRWWR